MPIDLTGISNENEFYSNHYLTTSEEGPIRDRIGELDKDGDRRLADKMVRIAGIWARAAGTARTEVSTAGRVAATRDFAEAFLEVLGYRREQEVVEDAEGNLLPLLVRVYDNRHEDALWVVEAIQPAGEDFKTSPLGLPFVTEQFPGEVGPDAERTINDVITKGIFDLDGAPRYVMVLSLSEAVLVDRFKWGQSRVLRFDLDTIFTRKEPSTLSVSAAILHRASIVPMTGRSLLEEIEEESHRHAYGVSTALKAALREAIELLGNEAARLIADKRRARREAIFEGETALDERELTVQCIRYMYRLLFLLYVEARPELGFAPIKAPAYRLGYALESLRELELVPLRGADANGSYIADRLDRLFKLVFDGTTTMASAVAEVASGAAADVSRKDFTIEPIRVELFAPESTSLLNGLPFRDEIMQRIIRLMSLSDGKKGRRIGRISYAQLGISQLGSVYETLLAFTGFFARTDLIEVRALKSTDVDPDETNDVSSDEEGDIPAEDTDSETEGSSNTVDPLAPAWFVPLSRRHEFEAKEIVFEGTSPKITAKGTFIYRLSGRNREASASFYTPEPLARMLVSHALGELLRNTEGGPKLSSAEILELRICEPAMGSAAFLIEVVNQLADAYLDRKQAEAGKPIAQSDYSRERQKVRAYIADRNVFGVDLNPIAVELGQISLWLNCLHTGGFAPWFGDQLVIGNSLAGARRSVWNLLSLTAKTKAGLWYAKNSLPNEIGWRVPRKDNEVWHFLVPDPAMSKYPNYVTDLMSADDRAHIRFWETGEKAQQPGNFDIAGFFDRFDQTEVATVLRLSKIIDELFAKVADDLRIERARTNDQIDLWPNRSEADTVANLDFRLKCERLKLLRDMRGGDAPAYRRLKLAMDAWSSLFFWPLDRLDRLPSRAEFLRDMTLILEGGVGDAAMPFKKKEGRQGDMFAQAVPNAETDEEPLKANLFGEVDHTELISSSRWLGTAVEVAEKQRFVHFDLFFADILRERGGFDLVIGNPPWIKQTWREQDIMGDLDPKFVVKRLSATQSKKLRGEILASPHNKKIYLEAAVATVGILRFTGNARQMTFAGSGTNNLYKCFIDLSFRLMAAQGVAALIHQDNHLLRTGSEEFRSHVYKRLRKRFHFKNQLRSKMFSEINNEKEYSANIYGSELNKVCFDNISNAFLPAQIDGSYMHDGLGQVPGLKDDQNNWDARPHAARIVKVDEGTLSIINRLSGETKESLLHSKFIGPHSKMEMRVFGLLAESSGSFGIEAGHMRMDPVWHETGAQEVIQVIEKDVAFHIGDSRSVLTGPMIHVANPLYKSPRRGCRNMRDYEPIDLNAVDEDYIPRTNFKASLDTIRYQSFLPKCPWDQGRTHVDEYRIAFRNMVGLNTERSLTAAMIPPGVAHVHTIESLAFSDERKLLRCYPSWISLPFDYIVKATGRTHLFERDIRTFPWVDVSDTAVSRALRLSCLTSRYEEIWNRQACDLDVVEWSSDDPRLNLEGDVAGPRKWQWSAALRMDLARRQALVEIDVLVAMALDLELADLVDMYLNHFPVLRQNEEGTWYDQRGRIAWSCSKGVINMGYLDESGRPPSRRIWETNFAGRQDGLISCTARTDYRPNGPHSDQRSFQAPFTRCDRVSDYRRAWAHFLAAGIKGRPIIAGNESMEVAA